MDRHSPGPVDSLSPAIRARTILAGCQHVWVQRAAAHHRDVDDPDKAVLTGLIDVGGRPHVLLQPWEALPAGPVRATCTEVADEFGVLSLVGELGRRLPVAEVARAIEALHLGERCAALDRRECRWCPRPGLAVMPLAVAAVRVVAPVGQGRRGRPVTVGGAAFRAAEPDRWALHGADVAAHLEVFHQAQLLGLVRVHGLDGVTGVSVRSLDADGLVVTCLAMDGVADVVIPFSPRLDDPRSAARRLIGDLGGDRER